YSRSWKIATIAGPRSSRVSFQWSTGTMPWGIPHSPTRFWIAWCLMPTRSPCTGSRCANGRPSGQEEPSQTNNKVPASRCSEGGRLRLEWVATLPWSTWQRSRGLGGSVPMDWVAGFTWTEWQPSHGLGGRHPWNMQTSALPLCAARPRSSGGALLPRVLPPIRHLAYAGFWPLLGAFPYEGASHFGLCSGSGFGGFG